MIRIESLNEASRLAFEHMKPGALTNHVMAADEHLADIAGGKLFGFTWPGGVLFLRKRETYHLLSYVVSDAGSLPDCVLPEDTVAEIAYKPDRAGSAARGVEFLGQMGLNPVFERIRLTRPAGNGLDTSVNVKNGNIRQPAAGTVNVGSALMSEDHGVIIGAAMPQDIDSCTDLLYASFDRRTGHIPDFHELEASISAGHVLCMKDPLGAVCGLLRWIPRGASFEIRQLAIRENMRGKGLARILVEAFNKNTGGKKTMVWARDGYAPALKSYIAAGFAPDGWRSAVLVST